MRRELAGGDGGAGRLDRPSVQAPVAPQIDRSEKFGGYLNSLSQEASVATDQGAGARHARPADFATWGAQRGAAFAKLCLTMSRPERRRALKEEMRKVESLAYEFRKIGASRDEASLYIEAFGAAYQAQLPLGNTELEIKVI